MPMKTFAEFVVLEEAAGGGFKAPRPTHMPLPFKTPPKLDVHNAFGLPKPPKPKKKTDSKKKKKNPQVDVKKIKSMFSAPSKVPSLAHMAIGAAKRLLSPSER